MDRPGTTVGSNPSERQLLIPRPPDDDAALGLGLWWNCAPVQDKLIYGGGGKGGGRCVCCAARAKPDVCEDELHPAPSSVHTRREEKKGPLILNGPFSP